MTGQNQASMLTATAMQFREQGKLRDAVMHCDAAIRAHPDYAPAWLERGFVLASGGSMAGAERCYAEVVRLAPNNAAALAGLASIAARDGRGAEGRDWAARARKVDPGNAIAACALATIALEAGEAKDILALLDPLLAGTHEPSNDRALMNALRADALDRLGQCADAYAGYLAAKADFATLHADRFAAPRPSHRTFVEGIEAAVATIDPATWRTGHPPSHHNAKPHIFLLGYPRSGTTLVENVLASIPGVSALEERPTFSAADEAFLATPDGLGNLAALSADDATPFANAYWEKVASGAPGAPKGAVVDMDPLKATRLPMIAKLFPDARVVIMRRDPRDVVWSCFRTNFALSSAAYEFTALERAAWHYDAMMRLTMTCVDRLPLNTHVLRYDHLVHDFDVTTRALCTFAGLPWTPTLRAFDKTAQRRGVSTASAGQVRKGLYDGTRQWERYADQLGPVMPILMPWVNRFGFSS